MDYIKIKDKTFEKMIESSAIEKKIRLLGLQISNDYETENPLFIGVLNGCFMFMADLMREITLKAEISFIKFSSYKGEINSSGDIAELIGLNNSVEGRHIIIVEDIVDTGATLAGLIKTLKESHPKSIAVVSLLLKPNALKTSINEIKYIGFEIPNDFVVGYGLDYAEQGRNLKHIYQLK